jgi:hypothetical protein
MKTLALTLFIFITAFAWGFLNFHNGAEYGKRIERESQQPLDSSLSHLRNLNWLLARQIEREKGGEQLHPSEP